MNGEDEDVPVRRGGEDDEMNDEDGDDEVLGAPGFGEVDAVPPRPPFDNEDDEESAEEGEDGEEEDDFTDFDVRLLRGCCVLVTCISQ